MAKRANPYVEDFVPQSKVHVGVKQFNNNADRLKEVYDKTLQLLFKGAQKVSVQNAPEIKGNSLDKKDNMKQLFIGSNGALLRAGSWERRHTGGIDLCCCGNELESDCGYCEVPLCGACQLVCSGCNQAHCTRCSIVGSESIHVCVSCYS